MSSIRFDGQVAIVTGAGNGLGKTYALELARRGAAVVVNNHRRISDGNGVPSSADQVVEEIRQAGGQAAANYDSVGTCAGGEAIVQTALNKFGRVDILINNAGHLFNAPFGEVPQGHLDSVLEVHLKGAFYVTQPAFRVMKEQRYGRILFTSSAVGLFGNHEQSVYAASKGGVLGLMNVVALEGAAHGIKANLLLPIAKSRLAAMMPPEQQAKFAERDRQIAPLVQNARDPDFVMPLAVYLVSQACECTQTAYSAMFGRYARVFVGVGAGWLGPRDVPCSVEEVAAHWAEITSTERFSIPGSLLDESSQVLARLAEAQRDR